MRDTKQSLNARKRKWQGRGWKKNNSCALTRSTPDNHVKHSSKKSKVENEPKSASSVMNSTVRTLFGDDAKPLMSYLFARGLVIEEKHCDKDLWRGLERCIIIVDSKFSRNDPSIDKNIKSDSGHCKDSYLAPVTTGNSVIKAVTNPYKSNSFINRIKENKQLVSESLSSLVDGVIYTLVHQEHRLLKLQSVTNIDSPLYWRDRQQYANVLSLGYKLASDIQSGRNCNSMPVGVQCDQPNTSVSFIKTNKAFSLLHRAIGDEELRIILLYSTLLMPIGQSESDNYIQLCGAPLHGATLSSINLAEGNIPHRSYLPRHLLFYCDSFVKKVGLPHSHKLNDDSISPLEILKSIFQGGRETLGYRKLKRLKKSGINLCDQIRKRNQRTNFLRILERCCPIVEKHDSFSTLVSSSSPSDQVVKFIMESVQAVFPIHYFGDKENLSALSRHINRFILMRRHEQISRGSILDGISVGKFTWLDNGKEKGRRSLSDFNTLSMLVSRSVQYVFCQFVIPLIRSCFYVTETEYLGNEVKFYRKPVWSKIRQISYDQLSQRQYSEVLNITEFQKKLSRQQMGCSKLRILPKKDGIRPIAVLSKRKSATFNCTSSENQSTPTERKRSYFDMLSTNMILKRSFEVLKYEHERLPEAFGYGVLGMNQIYPLLLEFLKDLRSRAPHAKLYFACTDIHRCYDTMNQEALFGLMNKVLLQEQYFSQKYSIFHPFRSMGRIHGKYKTKIGALEDFEPFHCIAENLSHHFTKSIFVDGVNCGVIKKSSVLKLLHEHIFNNFVFIDDSFGPRYFLQSTGIPQGSVLSSYLCNYFYGKHESSFLQSTLAPKEEGHCHLLIRLVDDYILITTDKASSQNFLKRMHKGNLEMGFKVNRAKSLSNHDLLLNTGNGHYEEIHRSNDEWFPWCGMLINTESCEVRVDYSRFKGSSARDSLTVDYLKNGNALRVRMKSFIRPRCQPIFFDEYINSSNTVHSNFYQAVLFTAIKTVFYVDYLPGKAHQNESYIQRCIEEVIIYGYRLVKRRLSCASKDGNGRGSFTETRAMWLGRHAFQTVLQKRNTQFLDTLTHLNRDLSNVHESRELKHIALKALKLFDLKRFEIMHEN